MKKLMNLGYAAMVVTAISACSKDEVLKSTNVEIADDQLDQELGAYDSEGALSFVATESWTAIPSVDWISITQDLEGVVYSSSEEGVSGEAGDVKLVLTLKANTTGVARKGNVTIKTTTGVPVVVEIEQLAESNVVTNIANSDDPNENTLAASLEAKFGEGYEEKVKSIKVEGSLNNADFKSLLSFEIVDLSDVDVVGAITVYPSLKPMEDAIPFFAFVPIGESGRPSGPNQTLKTIFMPNEVTHIGAGAFGLCTELVDVTMPSDLEVLMPQSFYQCGKLKNINSWGKLTTIQDDAFKDCVALDTIVFPNTLKTVGNAIFPGSFVKKVVFPESLETLGVSVFASCPELVEVVLPAHISLNTSAQLFQNCPKLSAITLSDATTAIPMNFATSSGIKTLNIPEVVTSIESFSFADCKNLETINVNWTTKESIPTVTVLDTQDGHGTGMSWVDLETLIGSFPGQFSVDSVDNDNYITVPKNTIELYKSVEGWESYKLKEAQ